jgi:aminoglycoside phosphotransferase family enzyme/predicted kinase
MDFHLVEALRDLRAYPHPVESVEVIETHISWVFLVGELAYKVKKPVNLGFCDFTTLERRKHFCEEELRLNRRTALDLYLGVVPIARAGSAVRVEGTGEPIEYAVKMRRFAQEMLLDRIASAHRLSQPKVDALARVVSRMHDAAQPLEPGNAHGSAAAALEVALANFAAIESAGVPGSEQVMLTRLREWTLRTFRDIRGVMEERFLDGAVRECHGDLHLGNIVLIDGRPTPFDAIEFDPGLRWIDVMSDAAFVAMDLEAHGLGGLASRFITSYLEASGDYAGLRVLRFYCVYRAMVRAKIERLRAAQSPDAPSRFAQYLELAHRSSLAPRPFLAITCGASGSGKSTVAMQMVEASGAVRIRSDVERKRMHGVEPDYHAQYGLHGGMYSRVDTELVYRALEALAEEALAAGYPVVVDATFLERSRRERFRALAARRGVRFEIVSCEASEAVLRRRVIERWRAGADPSDARLDVLQDQLATRDPIAGDEAGVIHLCTEALAPA